MPIIKLLLCEVKPEIKIRFDILPYGKSTEHTKWIKRGIIVVICSFAAMCLSVVCIVATIIVYVGLPDLRNTHGKSLLGYLLSLLVAYTVLAAVQLNGTRYVQPLLCSIAGYLIYFGYLSSFLWLNIISIDLWLNFR